MRNVIIRLWSVALRPLEVNGRFFVFMGLLGTLCIVFEPWDSLRPLSLIELLPDLYIVCALLCVLPHKARGVVRWLLSTVAYIVCLLDCFLFVRTGAPMQSSVLRAMLATTPSEASEALHAYVVPSVLLSPVGLIVVLAILHVLLTLRPSLCPTWVSRFCRRWGAPLLLACIPLCFVASFTNRHYMFHRLLLAQRDTELPQHIMDVTIKTGYYTPLHRLWHCWLEVRHDGQTLDALASSVSMAQVDSCSYTSPNIVLIVGESLNRHHLSLYGYPLKTCPYTETLAKDSGLIVLTDVVTPWNYTTEALEHMFSLYSFGDKGFWTDYPLVTTLFRRAGYHVQFISNQYVINPPKNTGSLLDTGLFVDSTLSSIQFDRRNATTHTYDEALLQDYDSLSQWRTEKNLTIFHLIGQHIEFGDRVPDGWHRFKATDYHRPDLTESQLDILADYDNATLYGDYVVSRILDRLKDENVVVIFLPDHGERSFDGCQTYGRSNSMALNDVQQQYEIPMWLWMSKSYRQTHSDIYNAIKRAKDLPFMSDRLPHLLIGLAGIQSPDYKPSHDLLHVQYNARQARRLRGEYDYDSLCTTTTQ